MRPTTSPTLAAFQNGIRFRQEAQKWSCEKQNEWILAQLRHTVRYAYEQTDFYRKSLDGVGFDPYSDFGFNEFSELPVLSREDISLAGPKLLAGSVPAKLIQRDSTGGSTGEPTKLWLGPKERGWRDSGMEHFFERLGVPEGTRVALLWGHHLDPQARDSLRDRYQAFVSNVRWFDCLRLSPDVLESYHRELERLRPACIIGYGSALAQLAEHVLSKGYKPSYPTRCLITGAEKLWIRHRQLIEAAFGHPVHERYGARDAGCLGVQINPERDLDYTIDWANTLVEPEFPKAEAPILITKLHADAMPMLRYRIGDIGRFPPESKPGHPTFSLLDVLGRVADRISLPTGGWVSGLEIPHLLKDYPVKEFLFLQRPDYSVELQLVPQNGLNERTLRSIRDLLVANLPGLIIEIKVTQSVARTKSNKWRPVVSEVV
jgi:phenylacetate-CoA ligase